MSKNHFPLTEKYLEYLAVELNKIKKMTLEQRIKTIPIEDDLFDFPGALKPKIILSEPLDLLIDLVSQPQMGYFPPPSAKFASTQIYIHRYLRFNFYAKHPSLFDEFKSLKVEFSRYVNEALKSPFQMVNAESSKECNHFIFFEHLHIKLVPGNLLPSIELIFEDESFDLTQCQSDCFSITPVYLNNRDLTQTGFHQLKRIMLFIFLKKNLTDMRYASYCAFLIDQEDLLVCTNVFKMDNKHFFQSSRALSVLRSIAIRNDRINFYKVYRGKPYISWTNHVETCNYVDANKEQLDIWRERDERVYLFFIRNRTEHLDDNAFSPRILCKKYDLYDKRSARTLLSLNKLLFMAISDAMIVSKQRNVYSFFLHWISYTNKHKKLNSYVVQALINKINEDGFFSYSILDNCANQMVCLLDLLYERASQVWALHKSPTAAFYLSLSQDDILNSIFEYLYLQESQSLDDIYDENHLIRIKDISHLHKNTTLSSITEKIQERHRQALIAKLVYTEFSLCFEKAEYLGYTFEALRNTNDVVKEREVMHHCIADYHSYLACSEYAAFKITNGTERATLGVFVNKLDDRYVFRFNQCYGGFNAPISKQANKAVEKFMKNIDKHLIAP